MTTQTAKIVSNGNSQVVCLPEEFFFDTAEVYISKQGENLIISPKKSTWDTFFDTDSAFDDDFLADREDTLPLEREF
ncbi:MAG: type II toxin-antitoxin system VapB family antitoxin [Methylococcales bacterium]|nr:type II toxin-antitoxin system VapB family antitoxin [Methylococcales bacterium]